VKVIGLAVGIGCWAALLAGLLAVLKAGADSERR
jgi:hypothetical protein